MNKKRILILGIALILMALVVGAAFAGNGQCNRCDCEKFTYSGEESMGSRLCICGHRYIAHGSNN
ncbi:MAG: hypothetical protein LBH20_06570 [Treponema sp.]|nr:hypothetical protein [Treponema sp.]